MAALAWAADKLGLVTRYRSGSMQQDFLRAASDMGDDRLTHYDRAEDYYCGEHRVRLNTRERQYLEASGYRFAENYVETIVDAKANALRVRRFRSDDEELQSWAADLWRRNRMDAGQKRIHRGAVKLGDYFLILEYDPIEKRVRWCPNDPRNVKVVYDSDEALYGAKCWSTSRVSASNPEGKAIERLNIYWPDSIEKWFRVSNDGDWVRFEETPGADYAAWWTMTGEPKGDAIGIPIIHFANKPNPFYGVSKARPVIPQQDALNKSIVDFFWVMDAQGWPQQWGSGVTAEDVKRHPGSLWTAESPDAKFGQLEPADPTKSISAIESQIKRMASRSNTPLHLMLAGGNLPSGESLKSSESGFIHEGEDFQVDNGNRYEDAVRLSRRIDVAFGESSSLLDDASLDCEWKGIETRNEVDDWNVAVLKSTLGVSTDTILSEQGYDPKAEREKRANDPNMAAQELLAKAKAMDQAPVRSEDAGGGQQPAQKPGNRRTA